MRLSLLWCDQVGSLLGEVSYLSPRQSLQVAVQESGLAYLEEVELGAGHRLVDALLASLRDSRDRGLPFPDPEVSGPVVGWALVDPERVPGMSRDLSALDEQEALELARVLEEILLLSGPERERAPERIQRAPRPGEED